MASRQVVMISGWKMADATPQRLIPLSITDSLRGILPGFNKSLVHKALYFSCLLAGLTQIV